MNKQYYITLVPGQQHFKCSEHETILDAALRQDINLPSGCRNGTCGTCKGRVKSGQVNYGEVTQEALSMDERNNGIALFCQAKPMSDLVIESESNQTTANQGVKTLPARIENLVQLADDVMLVSLKLPAGEPLKYLAGQYIDILFTEDIRRSFSIANTCNDDGLIELHIRRIPGGIFTEHVFTKMKVRDIIKINGPHGNFYLRDDSVKPVLLVAGGTGFAPIKAIVEQALEEQKNRPMTIYWGANQRSGLYLYELADGWAKLYSHIHFIPVLMEPWAGRSGFVHQAVLADYPSLVGHQVYVCGAPAMVDAAKRDFVVFANLPVDDFFSDPFYYAAAPALRACS